MKLSNLGIDIAKAKFNVCLLQLNGKLKHKVFPNTEAGFEQLSSWLLTQGTEHVHACLEATSNYGEALSLSLHGRGHTVSVVNPAAIKAFAASRLSRTKTDRVDAELTIHPLPQQETPKGNGGGRNTRLLTHLAGDRHVSVSTQNVALASLLFLYRDVLKLQLDRIDDVERVRLPTRLPVVFTREEVAAILQRLSGVPELVASLMYGSGLRLMECLRLRVETSCPPFGWISKTA